MSKKESKNKWLDAQQKHFNSEAGTYSSMYGDDSEFYSVTTKGFLDFVKARKGMKVLDIGCGFGRTTLPLLRRGCFVTGLDISQPTLDGLKKKVIKEGFGKNFKILN